MSLVKFLPVTNTAKAGDLVEIARGIDEVRRFSMEVQAVSIWQLPREQTATFTPSNGLVRAIYFPFGNYTDITPQNGSSHHNAIIFAGQKDLRFEYENQVSITARGEDTLFLETSNRPYTEQEITQRGLRILANCPEQMEDFLEEGLVQQITMHRLPPNAVAGNHYHKKFKRETFHFPGLGNAVVHLLNPQTNGLTKITPKLERYMAAQVETPLEIVHAVQNVGTTPLIFLETATMAFDPNDGKKDLYPYKIVG